MDAVTAIYEHLVRTGTARFKITVPAFAEMLRRRQASFKFGKWIDMSMMQRGLKVSKEIAVRAEAGQFQKA